MTLNKHTLLKKLFVGIFVVFLGYGCFAQNPNARSDFWNKVRFGGGIGLGFTNGGFSGSLQPSAIYEFNEQFAAGAGLNVNYYSFGNQKLWAYGVNVLTLFNPIPQIQLSVDFEQLRVNRSFDTGINTLESDYWVPGLFLGVGYANRYTTIGIRYDVLYDNQRSIYANAWMPFFRVYF